MDNVPASRHKMSRRTLQDNVYESLRDSLMSGDFAPGERLTVRGVAEAIGTSTMPVREALRRLTSEGGLEPLSSGATRVPILDPIKLQDLTEIRLLVEGLAIRRAAKQMTDEDLYELDQADRAIHRALKARDVANETRANERFHFCIYRAAHSSELLRIIEHLWLQVGPCLMWLLKQAKLSSDPRGKKPFRHHREIVASLKQRDANRAERALRADLGSAAAILIDHAKTMEFGARPQLAQKSGRNPKTNVRSRARADRLTSRTAVK
jgi:DNA-binding GntR family transcriptional regulator